MRLLLKAMGFWIWGMIAISLSASLVALSFRLAPSHRWHATPAISAPSGITDFKVVAQRPAAPPPIGKTVPKGAMISRVIGNEMRDAQIALQGRRWNDALESLDAAQAKSPLTAFDLKTIYDFKAFAYIKINNLKAAQAAYEAELATGIPTAESGAANADDLGILAQLYYLQKDCKNSAVWADKAAAAARKAGEAPKENLYQFKLQCASDAGDTPGMDAAAVDLIRLTNKANYWNTLLRIERQDERDDHNLLMIYRIMYDTSSMTVGTDFIEMAQLLGDAALPAEAQTVLEKAMAAGLIQDAQKERATRLLNSFEIRAEADKSGQAQLDAETTKSPAGELDVKLGEVYYGSGDYQNAVTAITRGIGKGQIKRLDEAYVYLGRAQVAQENTALAKSAFVLLKSLPNTSPRVTRLWSLYAETIGQ
jgi:hypothetical protein